MKETVEEKAAQMRSVFDLFHSYRMGWRDAAYSKMEDPKYLNHPTRPDLTTAYKRGYNDGRTAFNKDIGKEMKRLNYKPDILRGPLPEPGERGRGSL